MPSVVASPLGSPVPSGLPHAVSVSLPTWQDNVDYEEGAKRVVDVMKTGYPRFFIHKSILKLATICEQKFGSTEEKCMLFPSSKYASACRDFIVRMASPSTSCVRIVQFFICPDESDSPAAVDSRGHMSSGDLHIALFHSSYWPLAKAFWQHTGTGISSRYAEHCLRLLADTRKNSNSHISSADVDSFTTSPQPPKRGRNRHYHPKGHTKSPSLVALMNEEENEERATNKYLEERYARNLHPNAAADAKRALRRRIAGVLVREDTCPVKANGCSPPTSPKISGGTDRAVLGPSTRGVPNITQDDVFLFQAGMCAIWHTHQLFLKVLGNGKSVCWGFPYVDTLKVLQKWGPGCHFFGHGNEFDELEALLQSTNGENPSAEPPILALFCEVTSNPLLRTPDLQRLRVLADKYHFAIVVDETVGNFANVEVLPYSDVVCSSLTKIFSGETNVMGGGMILNPQGQFYPKLKPALEEMYEDVYWDEDALFLERNSRDFQQRVHAINKNAELICDLLHSRSEEALAAQAQTNGASATPVVVKKVYYPKFITTDIYNSIRTPESGYGGLFSLTFTSETAAKAFFDGLGCEKGPSLGTNFTLACPFVILAHYTELEWAKQFGVDPYLVRVSVGLESPEVLVGWIETALKNAENAARAELAEHVEHIDGTNVV
ncbi:hypothetical protein M408DRAFT_70822 [Serendipita vermifera MAFF 305830]|uniref:Cystathionine gamma-synthase n=1 Tax=Serendipita vermifera MAFF 305830 TaxID=933852 RepID=A0A0C2XF04_SERVB|nr:hypothetical protein M408DRAFT_70822 [Serendipita vermifera MAFF 305830]